MLVHGIITPSIKFVGTHLYTWMERGTVRIMCPAQEHSTMVPSRAQNQTTRCAVKCTNHEDTMPPIGSTWRKQTSIILFMTVCFDRCHPQSGWNPNSKGRDWCYCRIFWTWSRFHFLYRYAFLEFC